MKRLTLIDRGTRRSATVFAGLLVLAAVGPMQAEAQDTGRVFALLAIDTDARIAGLEDDERGMTAALVSGFGSTRLLNLRVLKGAEVRPDVIVNYFRSVPNRPDDALTSYRSGWPST